MIRDSATPEGVFSPVWSRTMDYVILMKPELTMLAVLTALGGAYLAAAGEVHYSILAFTLLGTVLVGGGAGALNQYLERKFDAMMRRTENRPLPSGRLRDHQAILFGIVASISGVILLGAFTHILAGALAAVTLATYLFLYTPLKRITPYATVVGGIPGALPPLIGWAAVTGDLTIGAWSIFFVLFFWQMPHFLSLAWMYRKDYARAGFKMLTVVEPTGASASRQILIYCLALIPAVLFPALVGILGVFYAIGAFLLSIGFLALALRLYSDRSNASAKRLFHGSLIFLSGLMGVMLLDRIV